MTFSHNEQFYTPDYHSIKMENDVVFFDPEYPNWIATDEKGAKIISLIKNRLPFNEIINRYSSFLNIDAHKGWLHINSFIHSAIREKFISTSALSSKSYTGRADHLTLNGLTEFWIQINNKCNLSCSHCLVESGSKGAEGLRTDAIKRCVDQSHELGASRFFITGGEPLIRKDIFECIDYIADKKNSELIILTNGTLLTDKKIKELSGYADQKINLQISLDGSTPEMNDPVRGKGSFLNIIKGIKNSIDAGLPLTVTTAVNKMNMKNIPEIIKVVSEIGVKNHHLLWMHPRGRTLSGNGNFTLTPEEMLHAIRSVKKLSDGNGLTIDNYEAVRARVNSHKGVKYDGSNACWQSLCIFPNGDIYPSASLAGVSSLRLGNIENTSLKNIWRANSLSEQIRKVSVAQKEGCSECFLKYICGGGDMESTYLHSVRSEKGGDFHSLDPYCSLYKGMILDIIHEEIKKKKELINCKSGFDAPIIFAAKGRAQICCDPDKSFAQKDGGTVETLHSNCVLSIDLDTSRKKVREFYSKAAEKPEADLCCPTVYDKSDTAHIPEEVIERFYGCGSPMSMAGIKEGETAVDLGSGAGIDCFIAAKKVGGSGKVIGVDMTDKMLEIANKCNRQVVKNLGYDIVEFRKGFLENIPVDDRCVDIITSNCVINLSPDKKMVFRDMWRILKDFGRILISDIVSEEEIPPHMQANPRLWGECISGAVTEDAFIASLEEAGFYGISLIKKVFWKEVEGYTFFSITVRGYKFEKKTGCVYKGEKAVYTGPYKSIMDEEGHLFPRGEAVEICTDTSSKLSKPPYNDSFVILTPDEKTAAINIVENCCGPAAAGCC